MLTPVLMTVVGGRLRGHDERMGSRYVEVSFNPPLLDELKHGSLPTDWGRHELTMKLTLSERVLLQLPNNL
jgi:hypothetical protein